MRKLFTALTWPREGNRWTMSPAIITRPKAAVVAYLKKSFADGAAMIKSKGGRRLGANRGDDRVT
jgi:hypothetical protein